MGGLGAWFYVDVRHSDWRVVRQFTYECPPPVPNLDHVTLAKWRRFVAVAGVAQETS